MKISDLQTPALVLDAAIVRKNSEAMKRLLKDSSLRLRPHYKSHKCAAIAAWQIREGAIGMTCAKLGEAEDLCDAGIEDILIANQIVSPDKVRSLATLAGKCRLTVCVDEIENVRALARAAREAGTVIRLLVEFDIGMERCGVKTKEEVLSLAREIQRHPSLVFEGLQAYAGHVSHMTSKEEREERTAENDRAIRELIAYLEDFGIEVHTVSGGSTGTASIKAAEGLYTELQAGSYLFMDATYAALDLPFEQSLFLLTTVVSKREGLTVVDAGVKTCGLDQGDPKPEKGTLERIVASEEHFQLHGYSGKETVGEKLLLVPAHCCSTVNLHDKIYLVEEDRVIARIPVTARVIGR